MTAVLRLECVLTEELAYSQRAHLKLVPLREMAAEDGDELISDNGKLTVDVPDSANFAFERGRFYRAAISQEE